MDHIDIIRVTDDHVRSTVRGNPGRCQLRRHAAGSHIAAGASAHANQLRCNFFHQADKFCLRILVGILGIQPVNVGHEDQQIRADEGCYNGRKPVIITKLNLMGRHGIVLVDHRNCPQAQKLLEGILGIDPGILVGHGILCQKHLRRNVVVLGKDPLVHHHEPRLAHSRVSLLLGNGLGAFLSAQGLPSGRNRAGGNQNDVFPLSLQITNDADQLFNLKEIQLPGLFMGQGRRTDLNYNTFLGDAVLEIVSSDFLYKAYPDKSEGDLTKLRASLVCEPTLAICTREMELGKYLFLGKGENLTGGRNRNSILSDALEAVIGAIYLDGGFEHAKTFIHKFILTDIEHKKLFYDCKTSLQEVVQGHYEEERFSVEARIGERVIGTGIGHTKKAAEQEAAYQALLLLKPVQKK